MTVDPALADDDFCYVTTTGRITGKPHTIEIWFALECGRLYLLAGGRERADWVRNIGRAPEVRVRIGGAEMRGRGRIVESVGEDALARRLLVEKYGPRYSGDLSAWGREALPVAVELEI